MSFDNHKTTVMPPAERIENAILLVRGQKVILDRDLAAKLAKLEKKYDKQFRVVFTAIRELMAPPAKRSACIGFQVREPQAIDGAHRR
jgi:hypothetical protein